MLKKTIAAAAVAAAAGGVLLTGTPAFAHGYGGDEVSTSGNGSILGGNQLVADANVPINVCGNSIAVLGVSGASCQDSGAAVHD
ncbi:hypothetical protein FHX37_3152 [Haloactinospora alba]|uniref:Chaplin domain-containing protein n=1 Tax=Haloactinospora alba TaxID=405555 RepID=A0A543NMV1_9ACTN|nr:chaplin family protein [Haloactinospora alba]TQN33153.1 hypothetical protein FHX37_3152 [Haloactinospora alba]